MLAVVLCVFPASSELQVEMGFKSFGSSCDRSEECNRNLWLECYQGKCNCTKPSETIYDQRIDRCTGKFGSSCFQWGVGPYCQENSICKLVPQSEFTTGPFKKTRAQYHGQCQAPESQFHQDCDDTREGSKCAEGMACRRGKCDCNPDHRQYYDETRQKCSISPGGRCNMRWDSRCGNNSICTPNNKDRSVYSCQCSSDSELDEDSNQCKIRYLGRCNSLNRECNPDKYLNCLDGICICRNPLNHKYSLRRQICMTLVGSSCNHPIGKVDKTPTETKVLNETKGPPCTENADCLNGKCECSGNYFETPDRTCQRDIPYESACEDGQCNNYKGMVCRQGKCSCFDQNNMLYQDKHKACLAQLGSACGKVTIDGFNNNQQIWIGCARPATCAETTSGTFKCLS
ncbi:unnamed protein product [Allacma fusca]|uniref:Uncharacterized protein n=1 Tax=Allacma fusca TaxID=39272 RepID=A0A8J2KX32_9HEXA|nr:unnamed protein product [Allacma fusca]